MKRFVLLAGTLLLATSLALPGLSAQAGGDVRASARSRSARLWEASAWSSAQRSRAPVGAAVRRLRKQGYLVRNETEYERAKAAAAARSDQKQGTRSSPKVAAPRAGAPMIASGDPDVYPAWNGISDDRVAPPDTTGAIGPTRYVELTNLKYAIYDRNGGLLATGGLAGLAGDPLGDLSLTDPQIIWDPGTNRFYYTVLSLDTNSFDVGFSKTASPSRSSDWCKYFADFGYGPNLPDYPKLGDTRDFWMFGVNVFGSLGYLQSDVDWISKPPAGRTCPRGSRFRLGVESDLTLHDATQAFTPVPANQTDTSGTGYVVATPDTSDGFTHDFVDTFAVTKNASGNAVFGPAVAHTVGSYVLPPNAPQSGTSVLLDTLDGRLTQAVSGFDPFRGKTAVWTQHTVSGGAGSEVRWYEIDPTANPLLQPQGAATDASLYVFNGAISSDRKVSGSTKRFGDAAVVGVNTSSASDFVRIQMVSKWGDNAQSEFVEVKASPGFNEDFSCGLACRWGDYSGATPDPAANPYSNHGRVWLSNQWNIASADSFEADWRTYNWGTNPVPFVVLNGPTKLFQKSTSFPVSWFLGNQASLADVQYRRASWSIGSFSGPYPWKTRVPAGGATFTGTTGRTYCLSAQSYDDVAGPGLREWGFTAERCAVIPLDDRSLSASSGWSRLTGGGFFKGTFTRTTSFGKSLTRTGIHAKKIEVMVETCPTCGNIKIYWNGSLKHTYSLHAGSVHKMVYLIAASFSSIRAGTLKIVVSSSGKPVIIDALAVSAI
jgi:hypothetical protein